jgi:hypothetical protein
MNLRDRSFFTLSRRSIKGLYSVHELTNSLASRIMLANAKRPLLVMPHVSHSMLKWFASVFLPFSPWSLRDCERAYLSPNLLSFRLSVHRQFNNIQSHHILDIELIPSQQDQDTSHTSSSCPYTRTPILTSPNSISTSRPEHA